MAPESVTTTSQVPPNEHAPPPLSENAFPTRSFTPVGLNTTAPFAPAVPVICVALSQSVATEVGMTTLESHSWATTLSPIGKPAAETAWTSPRTWLSTDSVRAWLPPWSAPAPRKS